ncbi:hypothetical protein HS088_TW14G00271 [Tripterygium wilfordii]|uniref:Uncharacterized protein n=1 Tax=Tripterygium wilfordii TaxID=458696 RepID=A0A7J7CQI7_TRIWF|nr:hypothetical protein HS088_TW14G00271 [Tripterygium wilfordii]
MYNNSDHKAQYCAPMSPRISFSNDFADSQHQQHIVKQESSRSSFSRDQGPVSTDFEFSVTNNYSMMSGADELFFKGRLLPFKDNNKTTLREELLAGDDGDDDIMPSSLKPPKSSTRWKGLLGLKRNHIGSSKKAEKSSEVCESRRPAGFVHEEMSKTTSQVSEETSFSF